MTHAERIKLELSRISPKAICDDCLSTKLKILPRQAVNQQVRKLEVSPSYSRCKDICSTCGSTKIVISTKKILAKKGPPLSPMPISIKGKQPTPHIKTNQKMDHTKLKYLIAIGCKRVGSWSLHHENIKLNLSSMQQASPALYVFVANGEVMYVGKTSMQLSRRLYFYGKPGPRQSTNIRVNKVIGELLKKGVEVDIFALENTVELKVGMFTVSIPAALEDDIIKQLNPKWNIR